MLPRHAAALLSLHAAFFVLLHSGSVSTAKPHETPGPHAPTSGGAENITEGIHSTTSDPSRRRTGKPPVTATAHNTTSDPSRRTKPPGTATAHNTTSDPSRRTKPPVTATAQTVRIGDQSTVSVTVLGDEIETLTTDEQTLLPRFVTTEGREIRDILRPAAGDGVSDTRPSGTPPSPSPSGEKPAPRAGRDPTPSRAAVKSGTASNQSLDKSVKSGTASNQSLDKSVKSGTASNQSLDKSVKSGTASNQSLDKSVKSGTASNQSLDKSVKSGTASNQSLDKSVKSGTASNQSLDKSVKSGTASRHSLNKSKTAPSSLSMSPSTSPSPLSSSPTTLAKKSSSDATTKPGQGITKGTPKKAMLLPSDLTTKSPQSSISTATIKTATLTSDVTTTSDQNGIAKATPNTSMPIPSDLTTKADQQSSITKATPGAAMLNAADEVASTTTPLHTSPSSTTAFSEVPPSHTDSPVRSAVPQRLSHVKGSGAPVGLTAYVGVSGEAGETEGLRAGRTAVAEPLRASRHALTTTLSAAAAAPELRLMPDMLPQPLRVSQEVLSAAATQPKPKPKTKRAAATEKSGTANKKKKKNIDNNNNSKKKKTGDSTTGTATKNRAPAKSEPPQRQLQLNVSPGLSAPTPSPKKGNDAAAAAPAVAEGAGGAGSNSSLQQCPSCDRQGRPGPAGEVPQFRIQAAVSAVLTRHFGPDKDVIVPFDLELVDLADNYDNESGVFFCSVPGIYVIAVHLMSHPGSKVNARIFVNNRPVAALWADDSQNGGFYPSSSIQTISHVGFGDQVYVMLVDGGYGDSWVHANYNVFTIFLLYEDFMGS